jgi:hypothetical protein
MAQITFTDVTATQVWDLLIPIKMRISRLEPMITSEGLYTEEDIAEFLREIESLRAWEIRIMAEYMTIDKQERFTASFEIAGL